MAMNVLKSAQRGSEDAIEALVRAHWDDAFRLALGIVSVPATAEDVAQEAILAAVRSLDSFDRRRPFRPWLHTIVTRRALDAVRARSRRGEVELIDTPAFEAEAADRWSLSPRLSAAFDQLDERARAAVTLRHVLGYQAKEIGEIVGTSESNVRSILHRSLLVLKAELEAKEVDVRE